MVNHQTGRKSTRRVRLKSCRTVAEANISGRTASPIIRVEGDCYEDWTVSISAKLLSAEKAQVLVLADYTAGGGIINGDGLPRLIQGVASVVAAGIPGQKTSCSNSAPNFPENAAPERSSKIHGIGIFTEISALRAFILHSPR